jgi:hypothetical protein
VTDVWGKKDTGDVGSMCDKLADGEDGGGIATLYHAPDVDVALKTRC